MSWKRPYNNKDINKSLRWVKGQPHNAGILIDAISVASEREVRIAATKQLHDLHWLTKAFFDDRNDPDIKARVLDTMLYEGNGKGLKPVSYDQVLPVINAVTEPDVIKLLARHGHIDSIKKLTDQKLMRAMLTRFNRALYDSALYDENAFNNHWTSYFTVNYNCESECMDILMEKMTDESMYYDIFMDTPYQKVSLYYIKKLKDGGWINPDVLIQDDTLSESQRQNLLQFVNDDRILDAFAENMDSSKRLQMAAIYRITDPDIRKKYCEKYHAHEFEFVDSTSESVGDRAYITHIYRCKYCGECKLEDETYVY